MGRNLSISRKAVKIGNIREISGDRPRGLPLQELLNSQKQ